MMLTKIKYENTYPPALIKSGGKKYIVPGWIEVEHNTTLNDIEWVSTSIPKKGSILPDADFIVKSSKGTSEYTVKRINGNYSCNCKGAGFGRVCRHIKEIKLNEEK